jgi:hypothetical protein
MMPRHILNKRDEVDGRGVVVLSKMPRMTGKGAAFVGIFI